MTDMADVIRIHSQIGRDETGQYCKGCQHRYGYAAERKLHWHASEHVAAALSAAGYGLVADAKREAWDEAAEELDRDASNSSYRDDEAVTQAQLDAAEYLRARAAEMRQG